jgi:hypothetical protein
MTMRTHSYRRKIKAFHGSNRSSNLRGDAKTKSLKSFNSSKKPSKSNTLAQSWEDILSPDIAREITLSLIATCEKTVNSRIPKKRRRKGVA